MKVGVPKETFAGERRVALTPDAVPAVLKAGLEVLVQSEAGNASFLSDNAYREAGAQILVDAPTLFREADIVLKVQRPVRNEALGVHEVDLLAEGKTLISFLSPLTNTDLVKMLAEKRVTSFAMDTIPRIARAQRMDALSSQSSIAGYKAVLIGADRLGKYMPMMMTAAGTIPPAKVLVLGAGVAGLQAIATARRLGAIVEAFDVRPVVKEQVQSLGATFLEIEVHEQTETAGGYATELSEETQRRERELVHKHVKGADIVITTALIPGRRAPILITKEMVADMRAGSMIVDIAAESGGNCELTEPGKEVVRNGVTVYGPLNLPSTVPLHASQLYSRNISGLLLHMVRDGKLNLDFQDPIIRDCCITHQGDIVHGPTKALVQAGTRPSPS